MFGLFAKLRQFGLTKTNIVAFLMMIIGVLDYLSTTDFVKIVFGDNAAAKLMIASGALMVVLRFVTSTPVFPR